MRKINIFIILETLFNQRLLLSCKICFFTAEFKDMIKNTNTIWLPWWGLLSKK